MDRLRLIILMWLVCYTSMAQQYGVLKGRVVADGEAVPYAIVKVDDTEVWAVTDQDGHFELRELPQCTVSIVVSALGFAELKQSCQLSSEAQTIVLNLEHRNLRLKEVVVTARKNRDVASTYSVSTSALEHSQLTSISSISELLPGGKTAMGVGNIAANDNRFQLRSEANEVGNAAFGTAIEIDGIRVDNNGNAEETKSADLRGVSTTNIEAVEVITGIPSVEHGDLTSGLVSIRTKAGWTPWTVELSTSPNTKQISFGKGFAIGRNNGLLNVSADHVRSVADLSSPHQTLTRYATSLKYSNAAQTSLGAIAYSAQVQTNMGGLDTKSDPDAFTNTFTKQDDSQLRVQGLVRWLPQRPWLTSIEAHAAWNLANKQVTRRTNENSAASQPQIHATSQGYHIARSYDEDPNAPIIQGPTGYWYVESVTDNKPNSSQIKVKATVNKHTDRIVNTLMVGGEWLRSGNSGRGVYYRDARLAPTHRDYRYDRRPALNDYAFYVEDKHSQQIGQMNLMVQAGVRTEVSLVRGSDYDGVHSLSPRANARLTIVENNDGAVSYFSIGGGWGRAIKLPSFQVLNPRPTYVDQLSFATGNTSDGNAVYAYYTLPLLPLHNANLRWQEAVQSEVNTELIVWGTRLTISAYHNRTHNPYMIKQRYEAVSYNYTPVSAAEDCGIAQQDRLYDIDQPTGIVTVSDAKGVMPQVVLAHERRKRFIPRSYYANGSPVVRDGMEVVIEMPRIKKMNTVFRLDGKYYRYRSTDESMMQWSPSNVTTTQGTHFPYVGHYVGQLQLSVPDEAMGLLQATVANGVKSERADLNLQFTTHIPRVRLVVTGKLETTLLQRSRFLSDQPEGNRAYATTDVQAYANYDPDIYAGDRYIVALPLYYSSVDNPDVLLPFRQNLDWARTHDARLYSDLSNLVLKSATAYYMNPKRVSAYFAVNTRVSKEVGDWGRIAFYATNVFNSMAKVKESDTGISQTVYNSGYVPQFYYGLTFAVSIKGNR